MKYSGKNHDGKASSSPYPVQRLAPAMSLVDYAQEIETASHLLASRTSAQLKLLSQQMRMLQEQARQVLQSAAQDAHLHRVRCNFKKRAGETYHLYEKQSGAHSGEQYFSMLTPADHNGQPPHTYVGSFSLSTDGGWTPANS